MENEIINLQNDLSNKKMKRIYKNKTVRIFSVGLVLAGMVSLGVMMQGCSYEEDMFNDNMNAQYLDFDVNSYVEFTPTELNMLAKAIDRITKYVVFDGNEYVFDLKSPSEINISDRLFNYIYPSIQNMQVNTVDVPRLKIDTEFDF